VVIIFVVENIQETIVLVYSSFSLFRTHRTFIVLIFETNFTPQFWITIKMYISLTEVADYHFCVPFKVCRHYTLWHQLTWAQIILLA